jgi:hypothetical protein
MSGVDRFDFREWLVPPLLVPLFFALVIVGLVVIRG